MNLQNIIKWFLPKEDKFYTILEEQGKILQKISLVLTKLSDTNENTNHISSVIQEIEHEGDALVRQMEEQLSKTFITPIDREDLHLLSGEIDDVIDACNKTASIFVLYGLEHPTLAMKQLMNILVECSKLISETLPELRTGNYNRFYELKGAVKSFEKEADKIFRNEITKLFHLDLSFKELFIEKEILEKLENAIDVCDDIANTLVNLSVKHG